MKGDIKINRTAKTREKHTLKLSNQLQLLSLAQREIIIAHLAKRMTFVIINYLIKWLPLQSNNTRQIKQGDRERLSIFQGPLQFYNLKKLISSMQLSNRCSFLSYNVAV